MTARKRTGADWLDALASTGLAVRSARDALQVKGWLDTGNYALNWAVSGRFTRGYPLGHTVEIFGDPSTGKSFLVARALAMVQEAGGVALLDDTEGAYSADHSARLGVDVERLAYASSRTVQQHMATALSFIQAYRAFAKPETPAVLACDSLAQLSTDHERTELDKRDMSKAAELKKFFRVVGADLLDLPAVYLATNHTIAAIGSMFQSRTTPGGGGPKFMATIRLDLRAVSKIKAGADYTGAIVRVVVDKNRIVAPWKEVRLAIPFYKPIARASGLVPLLIALGVLREQGQFVMYNDQRVGRTHKSKDKFLAQDDTGEELLAAHPEILTATDTGLAAGTIGTAAATAEPVEMDDAAE